MTRNISTVSSVSPVVSSSPVSAPSTPRVSGIIGNTRGLLLALAVAVGTSGTPEVSQAKEKVETTELSAYDQLIQKGRESFVTVFENGKPRKVSFEQVSNFTEDQDHLLDTMSEEDWNRYESYMLQCDDQILADIEALREKKAEIRKEREWYEAQIREARQAIAKNKAETQALRAQSAEMDRKNQEVLKEVIHKAEQLLFLAEQKPSVLDHPDTLKWVELAAESTLLPESFKKRAQAILASYHKRKNHMAQAE